MKVGLAKGGPSYLQVTYGHFSSGRFQANPQVINPKDYGLPVVTIAETKSTLRQFKSILTNNQ
ncbi:MAG: hypothetical protein LBT47_06830 [Deltaproteobacteria bacterium]|nr:hypothetical protein [Deltaproteobacteria bacterium]